MRSEIISEQDTKTVSISEKIRIRLKVKTWKKANPDRVKLSTARYEKKHRERLLEKRNAKRAQRRLEDPGYQIRRNLSSSLRHFVVCSIRKNRIEALVGLSRVEIRRYLESMFLDGMSWDNYGEWHIDHIKPLSSFDLSNREQQKMCFHYSNMQPLWAIDNIRKGAKIT